MIINQPRTITTCPLINIYYRKFLNPPTSYFNFWVKNEPDHIMDRKGIKKEEKLGNKIIEGMQKKKEGEKKGRKEEEKEMKERGKK